MAKRQSSRASDSSYFTRLGMEVELQRLEERAAQLRAWLGKLPARAAAAVRRVAGTDGASSPSTRRRRKRTMSVEARKRISEAQKARWAKQRGTTETTTSSASGSSAAGSRSAKRTERGAAKRGRRKMSVAARKRISDAQKARWAKQKRAAS